MLRAAVWDAGTGVVFILGVLAVELVRKLFGDEGPPPIARYTLLLLELGFLVTAAAALIRAVGSVIKEFGEIKLDLERLGFFELVRRVRKGWPGRASLKPVLAGLLSSVLFGAFVALAAFVANAAVVWVSGVLVALLIGALAVAVWAEVRSYDDSMDSGVAGIVGCLFMGAALAFLAPSVFAGILLRLTGNQDFVHHVMGWLGR